MSTARKDPRAARRILAIASSGGHWQQLLAISEAFDGHSVRYATTVPVPDTEQIPDCNARTPLRVLWCVVSTLLVFLRFRPDTVISTGALPGLVAVFIGRLIGARTMWIDSVANVDRMSFSGRVAGALAQETLTQWPHLAKNRVRYRGSIL